MAAVTVVLFSRVEIIGQHRKRTGEHLKDFEDNEFFDLLYEEPGTSIVKTMKSRYRFERKPTPHVVQWDLSYVLQNDESMDTASTLTKWDQVGTKILPVEIHGTTALPGNGPKYFGTIKIEWTFDVPKFDTEAKNWIDTLASAFPTDPFLEKEGG